MQIQIFQVDAFTENVFGGNPAAVCPLESWLPDDTLQKIASENAVAETAFFVSVGDNFDIRWFTPEIEMDLCGHATLATAHVISQYVYPHVSTLQFNSKSGILTVTCNGDSIALDFPSRKPAPAEIPQILLDAFPERPVEVLRSRDYVLVYESEEIIRTMKPHRDILNQINIDPGGVIITAQGDDVDFVSRFFTPQASIFEDPVTGSAHCTLIPYWSARLHKKDMIALQLSDRVGKLQCKDMGERVLISGQAVTYMEGMITI